MGAWYGNGGRGANRFMIGTGKKCAMVDSGVEDSRTESEVFQQCGGEQNGKWRDAERKEHSRAQGEERGCGGDSSLLRFKQTGAVEVVVATLHLLSEMQQSALWSREIGGTRRVRSVAEMESMQ
jgi:hypothetical protein